MDIQTSCHLSSLQKQLWMDWLRAERNSPEEELQGAVMKKPDFQVRASGAGSKGPGTTELGFGQSRIKPSVGWDGTHLESQHMGDGESKTSSKYSNMSCCRLTLSYLYLKQTDEPFGFSGRALPSALGWFPNIVRQA